MLVQSESLQVMPGPRPVDSYLQFLRHYGPLWLDPLGEVGRRFERYGDIYRVVGRSGELLVARDPAVAREVLLTQGTNFGKGHSAFARLRRVLGEGLLTSEGEVWRRQRSMLQPAFARTRLREYGAAMVSAALKGVSELRGRTKVSVTELMTRITLRIVAQTLFGETVEDAPRVTRAMSFLNQAFSRPELLPEGVPSPTRWRIERAVEDLDSAVFEMTERRLQQPRPGAEDVLQRLLDLRDSTGEGLDRREIRDQLVTLYLAGHETTANTLSWTWYLLSHNREAFMKLRAELQRVLGGRAPTLDDLPELPYLQQVVKEALRLYPPAFALPRGAKAATRVAGFDVPAGSEVVVWTYFVHRLPAYFPEPLRFAPERFTAEWERSLPKGAYLPFGAGQRACIGQQFAMMEAQLVLGTLAQQVALEMVSSRPVAAQIGATLRPVSALSAQVHWLA